MPYASLKKLSSFICYANLHPTKKFVMFENVIFYYSDYFCKFYVRFPLRPRTTGPPTPMIGWTRQPTINAGGFSLQ